MKKIMLLLVVLLLILAGGFWFITSDKLNLLIAKQIEEQGSKFTEQSVTVEKVDMKLLKGAGTITGLVLNNPQGYSTTPAFSLDKITLDINIPSLTGDPIIIDTIIIDAPEALVEFNESGGSNIQTIINAINKNLPKSSTTKPVKQSTSSKKMDPNIIVKQFILSGVALRVDLTKLGNTTHKKILPNIKLANIGGDTGLPASELGGELIKQALSSIWKSAKKEQQGVLEDKLKNKVEDKAKELFNKFIH
ncbi:MAG: hypothetical protein OCD00_14625 [Colwellia sp.]